MKISSAFLVVSAALALPAWGAGSVDAGRAAFSPFCGSCHENDPTAARFVPYRFNASGLTAAFQAIPAMNPNINFLGAQKINDIATYLGLVGLGLPNSNDTDRLLDWGEDTFPQLLSPRRQPTQQLLGYTYRFYSATGIYVGTKDGSVWFYDSRAPGATVRDLGSMRSVLDLMPNGR
jgi:cytochrome c553